MCCIGVMQAVLGSLGCSAADQSQLVAHLLAVHQSAAEQLGTAPRQFLACVDLYAGTVTHKREQLLQQQQFIKVSKGEEIATSRVTVGIALHGAAGMPSSTAPVTDMCCSGPGCPCCNGRWS